MWLFKLHLHYISVTIGKADLTFILNKSSAITGITCVFLVDSVHVTKIAFSGHSIKLTIIENSILDANTGLLWCKDVMVPIAVTRYHHQVARSSQSRGKFITQTIAWRWQPSTMRQHHRAKLEVCKRWTHEGELTRAPKHHTQYHNNAQASCGANHISTFKIAYLDHQCDRQMDGIAKSNSSV